MDNSTKVVENKDEEQRRTEEQNKIKDEDILSEESKINHLQIENGENIENLKNFSSTSNDLLISSGNIANSQPNEGTEEINGNLQEKRGKKKKIHKYEKQHCEVCNIPNNDKIKHLRCYTCKKVTCKNCADKETHYSGKKRDSSIYICANCFESQTPKIRKKNLLHLDMCQDANLGEASHNSNLLNFGRNYNFQNNNLSKTSEGKMSRRKRGREEDLEKKLEEMNFDFKQETLDLDILHDCVSPPSELAENSAAKRVSSSPLKTNKMRKKKRVFNNLDMDKVCHHCQKSNAKYEYFKCGKSDCGNYYCSRCIRKYDEKKSFKPSDPCYACRKICRCQTCKQNANNQAVNHNYINIDLDNLEENKNLVKIDDFFIVENEVPEEEEFELEANLEEEKKSNSDHQTTFKIENAEFNNALSSNIIIPNTNLSSNSKSNFISEEEKTKNYVKSVENLKLNSNNKIYKITPCIICNEDKSALSSEHGSNIYPSTMINILSFRSLEEFVYYLKHYFNTKIAESESDSLPSPEYQKSFSDFQEYYLNYFNKYYKKDYVFKSVKIICKGCFDSQLKESNGFNNIFNSLHIGHNSSYNLKKDQLKKLKEDQKNKKMQKNVTVINTNEKKIIKIPNDEIMENSTMNKDFNNQSVKSIPNNGYRSASGINPTPIFNPSSSIMGGNDSNRGTPNLAKLIEMLNNTKSNQLIQGILKNLGGGNIGNMGNLGNLHGANPGQNSNSNPNSLNNFNQFLSSGSDGLGNINKLLDNNLKQNENEGSTVNKMFSENNPPNLNPFSSDPMNVTNIIMNFDQNKPNSGNINGYMNNVLEELRKQFFCIQYYSLIQKLFISYIFKNLEMFIEQISKNQSLGEFVMNNMVSSLPKSMASLEGNSNELQNVIQNLNEQMSLLKNINNYGVNLTSSLNSNFEDLKNNGIKIFKSMDPNLHNSLTNNLNNLINTANNNNNSPKDNSIGNQIEKSQIVNTHVNENMNKSQSNAQAASNPPTLPQNLKNPISSFESIMNNLNGLHNITSPNQLSSLMNIGQLGGLNQLNQISNFHGQQNKGVSSPQNHKPSSPSPSNVSGNTNQNPTTNKSTIPGLNELMSSTSPNQNLLNMLSNLNNLNSLNKNPLQQQNLPNHPLLGNLLSMPLNPLASLSGLPLNSLSGLGGLGNLNPLNGLGNLGGLPNLGGLGGLSGLGGLGGLGNLNLGGLNSNLLSMGMNPSLNTMEMFGQNNFMHGGMGMNSANEKNPLSNMGTNSNMNAQNKMPNTQQLFNELHIQHNQPFNNSSQGNLNNLPNYERQNSNNSLNQQSIPINIPEHNEVASNNNNNFNLMNNSANVASNPNESFAKMGDQNTNSNQKIDDIEVKNIEDDINKQ